MVEVAELGRVGLPAVPVKGGLVDALHVALSHAPLELRPDAVGRERGRGGRELGKGGGGWESVRESVG